MAKIAIVFLLVALVAACNGARLKREEPKQPAAGNELEAALTKVKNIFNEENMNKLKKEWDETLKNSGDLASKIVSDLSQKFDEQFGKPQGAGPK